MLKIGDKIKWNIPIDGSIIYTILDIDRTREPKIINGIVFKEEVLFQWVIDGEVFSTWGHDYDQMIRMIKEKKIFIVGRSCFKPIMVENSLNLIL